MGRTESHLERATAALDWIRTVRRLSFSDSLKDRLSSLNASEERNRLREAAVEGASLKETYQQLIAVLARDFGICNLETLTAPALIRRIAPLVDRQIELGDFLALRRQRENLARAGLADFLASADKLLIDAGRLTGIFEACVGHQRANRMRQATQALAGANGQVLEACRTTFADRDRLKIEVDRRIVKDKLLRSIPPAGSDYGPRKTWTDTALLRNEFAKQARFTPVRSVLMRAAHSVQTLKPCFMMSPLSLAKFLTPAKLEFDLVVIDEASQMKPEDALGGLLRAKQIVVVGDPKQLPPSDFFTRSDGNPSSDDEFEDVEDESILEACQKSFRELRRLKWHYRSRCESLIAFSNAEFYDNTLMTFPQARPESFSVNLVRVDGAYQARCNDMEAERLVEEALKFMRHFADEDESTVPTLGIVAVNIAQRDLLREKLNGFLPVTRASNAIGSWWKQRRSMSSSRILRTFQGDERDYIFVSLTYGREPGATTMKQRFGPINGKQGHRRLNVLFSRARVRISLFASFGSADVKPPEGSHQGLHILKRYLEYAETRGQAVVKTFGGEPDSDFEIEVSDRLRDKGYQVVRQVGVSGYKIDLGIRHPDYPEMFLAGVECDGASYHSSKSARDRDRLREEVLRGLGWSLVRVWSTDWFDNVQRQHL
jgi:very-short-patch-repair endonuclease